MFGKLLGAIVGLVLGLLLQGWAAAVVLALLGAYVGHRYDELHQDPAGLEPEVRLPPSPALDHRAALGPLPEAPTEAELDAQARAHFARHVTALFAEVARADGELVRDEVRVVRDFFQTQLHFTPRELELVRTSLKEALAQPVALASALAECVAQLPLGERLLLLDALYELALSDGPLGKAEREALRRVSGGLEIPAADQRAVAALHLGEGGAHYERLGLSPDATDEEVKSAWRRLAATHHPDKVAHLGPGAVERAARSFRELKEAYDQLRRLRGF